MKAILFFILLIPAVLKGQSTKLRVNAEKLIDIFERKQAKIHISSIAPEGMQIDLNTKNISYIGYNVATREASICINEDHFPTAIEIIPLTNGQNDRLKTIYQKSYRLYLKKQNAKRREIVSQLEKF